MLSVKLVTFWILRKYSFGIYDGNSCFSTGLPEHRLADEVMWEKLILCANKGRQVKENTFL